MRAMRRGAAIVAVSLAATMGIAACGNGDDDRDYITANTVQPENPLIPGNTSEVGGGRIVDSLFTGLTMFEPGTGETVLANAESIETTDSQTYTITLNDDWTFHDGTEVKAQNYVDAWNYTAYSPNGQTQASFFANIQGYTDVHTEDPDGDGPQEAPAPTSETMSGLEVVDDTTFTVTLTGPSSYFETSLGYTAFSPMPDSFFDDPEAFEDEPIGNGPFKFVDQTSTYVEVERFDEYGGDAAKAEKLRWVYYTSLDTAYKDVRDGKLDFLDQVPPSKLTSAEDELDGRYINEEVSTIGYINLPTYDPKYSDPQVRRAIAMAINWPEITDSVFDGTRVPASDYVPPSVPGHEEGLCGETCTYQPEAAKALLDQAGGFQGDAMELWYNADGGHKQWTEAACQDIAESLEVPCTAQPTDDFSNLVGDARAGAFTQMYRLGWQADYPHIQNFLGPLFVSNAASNFTQYSSEEFDAKMAEADATADSAQAIALYKEAEQILIQDMPVIPTFYYLQQSIYSDKVQNAAFDWRGVLDFTSIEFK